MCIHIDTCFGIGHAYAVARTDVCKGTYMKYINIYIEHMYTYYMYIYIYTHVFRNWACIYSS